MRNRGGDGAILKVGMSKKQQVWTSPSYPNKLDSKCGLYPACPNPYALAANIEADSEIAPATQWPRSLLRERESESESHEVCNECDAFVMSNGLIDGNEWVE